MGNKQRTSTRSSKSASLNPAVVETVAVLEKTQLLPHTKASPDERRRLQAALSSAQYISNCQECVTPPTRTSTIVKSPTIVLYHGGSFEAAEWAREHLKRTRPEPAGASRQFYKPVVLDFASDSNPGGGWRGRQQGTQEEELCRMSSLGLSLERLAKTSHYSIPTMGCVYVPDVAVVRQAMVHGEETFKRNTSAVLVTWKKLPFWCAVIAAALRHADGNQEFILSKIRGVMAVANAHGHGALVGGAWGCGAFGNEAEKVAQAWRVAAKGLLQTRNLELLVLALPSVQLLETFQSVLTNAVVIKY